MIKQYLKKLIKEVLEKDGIESLKIGEHTAYVRNDKVHVSAATPKIQLQGTEGSAMNLSLRENAGVIELYDETVAVVRASWSGTTGRRITPLINDTEIASNAVITAKILDAAITQPKIKIKTVVALADAAVVLTATQMIDSGIFTITPTIARILTTDTAANLVAGMAGYQVGTWFDIVIVNTAVFDVTLTAGAGVTLIGKMIINNVSGIWRCRFDSAAAVTIYRM